MQIRFDWNVSSLGVQSFDDVYRLHPELVCDYQKLLGDIGIVDDTEDWKKHYGKYCCKPLFPKPFWSCRYRGYAESAWHATWFTEWEVRHFPRHYHPWLKEGTSYDRGSDRE